MRRTPYTAVVHTSARIIDPLASRRPAILLFLLAIWPTVGCVSLTPYPTQAPVRDMIEPETGRPYLLYVPSMYNDRRTWPLVIACHGTIPYDTPDRQMSEWAQFGEDRGILIAAPRLEAARGDFPPPPDEQIARQERDEKAILGIVAATKSAYRVAEEQVFLTGWSAAGYDILHTGVRNPDVFRALTIRQGNFDPRFLSIPDTMIDRWQPIKVIYGSADVLLRDQSLACIEWLRERGHYVEAFEIAGSHRRIDPAPAWEFFRDVVKKRPWIRIRATPGDQQPLAVRFSLQSIPAMKRVKWFFGDGTDSYDPQPEHVYATGGDYTVAANVELVGGKKYQRRRTVHVAGPP